MSASAKPWATSKAQLKRLGRHNVTCPSEFTCTIRIPDTLAMIEAGKFPDDLLDYALREATGMPHTQLFAANGNAGEGEQQPERPQIDVAEGRHLIKQSAHYRHTLVSEMLLEPELTPDEVAELVPEEDKQFLIGVGERRIIVDARGKRIGVMPLDYAAVFHRRHKVAGDPADCEACRDWQDDLSTIHRGDV